MFRKKSLEVDIELVVETKRQFALGVSVGTARINRWKQTYFDVALFLGPVVVSLWVSPHIPDLRPVT